MNAETLTIDDRLAQRFWLGLVGVEARDRTEAMRVFTRTFEAENEQANS